MRKRKKVRNGVRKGELSFKKEGGISFTLRDSCVPSRFEAGWVRILFTAEDSDSGTTLENGCCKKWWHWEYFACRSLCELRWQRVVLSGLVHFSFRIAVIECNWSLRSINRLRTSAMRKSAGKELKMFDKESVSLSLRNKDCSEHYGRRNCVKAKCPHKSTGIGCSGECDEPFFANKFCICFVTCRTIPLQKSAAKACFSAERIVIGLLWASVTYGLALLAVRSVRSTKKTALNYNFRV